MVRSFGAAQVALLLKLRIQAPIEPRRTRRIGVDVSCLLSAALIRCSFPIPWDGRRYRWGCPCGPLPLGGRVAGIPMFFTDNDSTAADSEAMIDQNRLKLNLLKIWMTPLIRVLEWKLHWKQTPSFSTRIAKAWTDVLHDVKSQNEFWIFWPAVLAVLRCGLSLLSTAKMCWRFWMLLFGVVGTCHFAPETGPSLPLGPWVILFLC